MRVTFRPVSVWPKAPTARRRPDPFRARYDQTLRQLEREVDVVVQSWHGAGDIRLDGMPRADARQPANPGVIVSFQSRHGPLSYPCDTYGTWEGNLRAIVLALESLRAVNRYGVSQSGEQYRGWTALPPPRQKTVYFNAAPDAAAWMARQKDVPYGPDQLLATADLFNATYRSLAGRLHPDRGGDEEEFKKLQEARALIEARHKGTV